jgi:hypothetical protein
MSLCLISQAQCHEDIWESGGIDPPFLASALGVSRPGRFNAGTHYIGGWVDPRAGLKAVGKRKILPLQAIEPGLSSLWLHRLHSM